MSTRGDATEVGRADERGAARIALEAAAGSVARDYAPQLVAAAKRLAAAAYDETTFLRVWVGIGELARSGALDLTQPQPAPTNQENENHE